MFVEDIWKTITINCDNVAHISSENNRIQHHYLKNIKVLINILLDEKNEKLTVKDYSSYGHSSKEDGLFVYEALCVDTFITFLSINYLNNANKSFLNWYDSKKYKGGV